MRRLVILLALTACSSKKSEQPETAPATVTIAPPAAAAGTKPPPAETAKPPEPKPKHKITLRSTPSGASAMVDGRPVGDTPTMVELEATGEPREFAFTKPGYEIARYKFATQKDGVVHATLRPIPTLDAGSP